MQFCLKTYLKKLLSLMKATLSSGFFVYHSELIFSICCCNLCEEISKRLIRLLCGTFFKVCCGRTQEFRPCPLISSWFTFTSSHNILYFSALTCTIILASNTNHSPPAPHAWFCVSITTFLIEQAKIPESRSFVVTFFIFRFLFCSDESAHTGEFKARKVCAKFFALSFELMSSSGNSELNQRGIESYMVWASTPGTSTTNS